MADIDSKKMETKNVQDLTLVVNKLLTDMVFLFSTRTSLKHGINKPKYNSNVTFSNVSFFNRAIDNSRKFLGGF